MWYPFRLVYKFLSKMKICFQFWSNRFCSSSIRSHIDRSAFLPASIHVSQHPDSPENLPESSSFTEKHLWFLWNEHPFSAVRPKTGDIIHEFSRKHLRCLRLIFHYWKLLIPVDVSHLIRHLCFDLYLPYTDSDSYAFIFSLYDDEGGSNRISLSSTENHMKFSVV